MSRPSRHVDPCANSQDNAARFEDLVLPFAPVVTLVAVFQNHSGLVPIVLLLQVAFRASFWRRKFCRADAVRDKAAGFKNGAFVESFLFAAFSRDMEPAVLAGRRLIIDDTTHLVYSRGESPNHDGNWLFEVRVRVCFVARRVRCQEGGSVL